MHDLNKNGIAVSNASQHLNLYSSSDCLVLLRAGQPNEEDCNRETRYRVTESSCKIGSAPEAELHFDTSWGVSPVHAEVVRVPGGAYIRCLADTLTVNGQPVVEAWLQEGDQLVLGKLELLVEQVGASGVSPVADPGSLIYVDQSLPEPPAQSMSQVPEREEAVFIIPALPEADVFSGQEAVEPVGQQFDASARVIERMDPPAIDESAAGEDAEDARPVPAASHEDVSSWLSELYDSILPDEYEHELYDPPLFSGEQASGHSIEKLQETIAEAFAEESGTHARDAVPELPVENEPLKVPVVEPKGNSVADVLARMSQSGEISFNPVLAEPPQPKQQEPVNAAPGKTTEKNTGHAGDDVNDYMAQLLNRLNGGVPTPQPVVSAVGDENRKQPARSAPVASTMEEEDLSPADLMRAEDFVPKSAAPETNDKVAAMRLLANQSTKAAIQKSTEKKTRVQRATLLASAAASLLVSVILFSMSTRMFDMPFLGGWAAGLAALLISYLQISPEDLTTRIEALKAKFAKQFKKQKSPGKDNSENSQR